MDTLNRTVGSWVAILAMVTVGSGCAGSSEMMSEETVASPSGATVECQSRNYQYEECWAGMLTNPQLIYQESSASCILNRTWGFNPSSGYIWVGDGCGGVFADVAGYHHGRGDTWDDGARRHSNAGHDLGEIAAGAVIGALLGAAVGGGGDHRNRRHTTSNVTYRQTTPSYSGCHGVGCLVDDPDDYAPNPGADVTDLDNWSDDGEWQGCHGDGCLVDDPDD